jgi:hypothetical protein
MMIGRYAYARDMQLVVIEENADGFTVVDAPYGLGEHRGDIQNVQLLAQEGLVFGLGNRVGHNHLVQGRSLDAVDGIPAEDTVCQQRVDFGSPFLLEKLGSSRDGVARIYDVVQQNADAVRHVAHKHHACVLSIGDSGRPALLQSMVK